MTEGATPCDGCGASVPNALGRTVQLDVDGSEVDRQRLCPDCFADWIARYDDEMRSTITPRDDREDIIVD